MSHRRWGRVARRTVLICGLPFALSGCASWRIAPTQPGPGVPVISNLRIEPDKLRVGEEAVLTVDFEDTDADLVEADIFHSEIREWVFTPAIGPTVLDLRTSKFGQAIGTITAAFNWESEGFKLVEVFVVDQEGNTSNKLRARVRVSRK